MTENSFTILHIEDDPRYAGIVRQYLGEIPGFSCVCIQRETLGGALAEIAHNMPDLLLLDPSLPDARGLEAVHQLRAAASEVPLVLLTGHDDEELALKALQAGAQDYVCKRDIDSKSLGRALRYAMERHRVQSGLRAQALFDDLTGLYNHRGFHLLAQQHLKLIARSSGHVLVVCLDLDDLKSINDHFGHQEGNRALVEVAEILKTCFRQSDVIGRLGGDEFAVLVTKAADSSINLIRTRLQRRLSSANLISERPYALAFSTGIVSAAASSCDFADLLSRADSLMYQDKHSKGSNPQISADQADPSRAPKSVHH
jgi:diguanylate cyclase (GGDEF)-like protein